MKTNASAIRMPFAEANAFFRQKVNMPSSHWTEVMDEAHVRGFAIARATDAAMIEDFRKALDAAILGDADKAAGGYQAFRADFDTIVKKYGWSHTGTADWRAQIIYRTNMASAYAAGRYAQMTDPDVLAAFPYWQYLHVNCPNPRLQHLAWSGLVLRADDPWWSTNYPPNGWGCHCIVATVSERALGRMGKSGPDKAPPLDWREYVDRTTGRVSRAPAGVDPGFAYNPGKAWKEGTAQPVKGLRVRPVDTAPAPVLAPPGAAAVKPDVLALFLRDPGRESVQIGRLPPLPGAHKPDAVLLPGETAKAARTDGIELDAALVAAIGAAAEAAAPPAADDAGAKRSLRAHGLVVSLAWENALQAYVITGISKAAE
jgi:hypothetical protein